MTYQKAPLPLGLQYEDLGRREQASLFLAEKLHQAGEEGAGSQEMRNLELSNPSLCLQHLVPCG